MSENSAGKPPYLFQLEEGEQYLLGQRKAPLTLKASPETGSSSLVALTEVIVPGDQIPVHSHQTEDEILFIHAGKAIITLGKEELLAKTGAFAFVPSGVWHGVKNNSDQDVIMLAVYTPTGMQDYFRGLGVQPNQDKALLTEDAFENLNQKFGVVYRGL